MENIINLNIEVKDGAFGGRLKVTSDKQLYDAWGTEEVKEDDFKFGESSLTKLYERLYDITQANKCIPSDASFYIDGKPFAKMVDGHHLEINEELDPSIIEKYGVKETIDFIYKDKLERFYGEDLPLQGIGIYRNDSIRAYRGQESDNYICNEDHSIDHKNKEDAIKALDFYLEKGEDRDCFNYLDQTTITIEGEKYKTMSLNKEIKEPKIEKPKKRNRLRR